MDGQRLEAADAATATTLTMTNEANATPTTTTTTTTAATAAASGLRRQPTKYPHGLNITVQTIADDDYSRASTLRSSSSSDVNSSNNSTLANCWTESQKKYKVGMLSSQETLAELQVRRYKYPLSGGNYYLNGAAAAAAAAQQKPTPLMLLAYARRACRWKYLRWPIIFVASVLLFFGLITYGLWLHDVSVARARFLQRRYEATKAAVTEAGDAVGIATVTDTPTATTANDWPARLQTTKLNAAATTEMGDPDYDDVLQPADSIRFTSGHQNSFGVPIEHDLRISQLLKELLPKPLQSPTPPGSVRVLTRVSPTLPPPGQGSSRPTASMTTMPTFGHANGNGNGNNNAASGCYSTMLPMCRGVLDYDLTYAGNAALRDAAAMLAYEQLISANCSSRAVEFICAALEPECRPSHIGQLPPCRRICKAILEACSIVIANSDALTELFDCNLYPDAHEAHKCDDPTRRRGYCYENEFECADGSCIPQQWQCDNIKDCAGGEDEQQCLQCEQPDEFRCHSNEKCVPEALRCDLNYDCFDGSDEEDCDDYGSGETDPFDEAELNAFPRIFSYASFLSPNQTNEKLYTYITATTDEEAGTETKYQVHQVAAPAMLNASVEEPPPATINAQAVPKGFVNFRDSKEIMMTSDSENKFKYSAQRSSNRTSSVSSTSSKFSVSTTPLRPAVAGQAQPAVVATTEPTTTTQLSTSRNCPAHQLRCVSGKCINVSQLCDKQVDCPDAADELMCIYRQRLSTRRGSSSTTTTSTTTMVPTTSTTTTTTTSTTSTTRRPTRTIINRSRKPKS